MQQSGEIRYPGEVLQTKLYENGMSRKELAIRTGVTEKHICTVISGERSISAGFARKLGYVFENSGFWLNLQTKFEEEQLRIQEENAITQFEIDILKPLQEIMSYLIECGYIQNNCGESSKVMQMRSFLGVSNLTLIPRITYNAAYRAQLTENVRLNPYVLFAWQRLCEKQTENLPISKPLNIDMLRQKVPTIKAQMYGDINSGIRTLQDIFADCGIVFQVVRNFRGAPVQGFIKETHESRLILCLTIRGKRADRFWFTLMHEIGHILHGDFQTRFVDFDSVQSKIEEQADNYARDELIPPARYREFVSSKDCTSWDSIEAFAEAIGVESFIVLGRLQNDEYLDWSDFSNKVVRYEWA